MKSRKIKPAELANQIVGGKLSQMATYSHLFEKTRDAIFLLDLETREVLESNPAAWQLLGSPELARTNLLGWATADSRDLFSRHLVLLRTEGATEAQFDMRLRKDSASECVLEVSASRLHLADYCDVIQLIAKDVTAERQAKRDLESAVHRLEVLSTTDELTGLFNVRHFRLELKKEFERAGRYKKPFSLILCDIDHFKNYNDKNGHVEGDEALKLAAATLKHRARLSDLVARYGGEEFVILCPEVDAAQAFTLAQSLRQNVEKAEFAHGNKQPLGRVTMSFGVASYPLDAKEPSEVLRLADEALYASKAAGRNRVTRYRRGLAAKPSKKESA